MIHTHFVQEAAGTFYSTFIQQEKQKVDEAATFKTNSSKYICADENSLCEGKSRRDAVLRAELGSEDSHRFLCADARLSGGGGARGDAVLGEDRFKLHQRRVGSNPRRVEVGPTHPEAGLRQVLQKLVQPAQRNKQNIIEDPVEAASVSSA